MELKMSAKGYVRSDFLVLIQFPSMANINSGDHFGCWAN